MKPTFYLGNKRYSSWSMRPWLVARKAGFDFIEHMVNLADSDAMQTLKQVSPTGKVPLWVDGKNKVWDSLAICEYFADQKPYLWPADPILRSQARSLSAEMHSGFSQLRTLCSMDVYANRRNLIITSALQAELSRLDTIFSQQLEKFSEIGPWLFGNFSIADAMYAPIVMRLTGYNLPLSNSMRQYINTWRSDADLKQWIKDGLAETWVLEDAGHNTGEIVNTEPLPIDQRF